MQIQGQLNIAGKNWCDFVLRRTNPYDIFIERIYKDETLWTEVLPKLTSFYNKFLLPELACPRHGTYSGIRKPQSPWYVQPAPSDVITSRKTSHCIRNKSKTSNLIPSKSSHSTDLQQQCNDTVSGSVQYVAPLLRSDGSKTSRPMEHSSSHGTDLQQQCNDTVSGSVQLSVSVTHGRSRRLRLVKFVGRKILHEWCVEDKRKKKKKKWYSGMVLDVVRGKDGDPKSVYQVMYEGDDELYEIEHLHDDYMKGSVKFSDI